MSSRKSSNPIDPVKVCTLALRQVKCAADYNRISTANSPETMNAAWEILPELEQRRIAEILNSNTQPDPQALANELMACGTALELKHVKSEHGDVAVKTAWKLLPQSERDRIKQLCDTQVQPQPELELQPTPEPQPTLKKPTLIELMADLQQLDDLLETIDGDNIPPELQQAVDELLTQKNQTHDQLIEKLDSYAALIQNRTYWAATRKAEAERLSKLAESDMKTVDFLKSRLRAYLEGTDQKKLRTKHFNISVRTAGGKPGLRLNVENPKDLPERFQRVIIEPDNITLREALLADDPEAKEVAYFAERTTYLALQ